MNPSIIRDELRDFLNLDDVSIAEIERCTNLNRSWLSKFKRGELDNPTVENLDQLYKYRAAWRAGRATSA